MSCDIGEVTFPSFHLRHSSFSNPSFASPTSQALHLIHLASRPCCVCKWVNVCMYACVGEWTLLILQSFRHFTYVTAHSPTLPSLYLRHSSFSNPSVASPTPQLIFRPFLRFSYVTGSSLTSPGEPPMLRTLNNNLFNSFPTQGQVEGWDVIKPLYWRSVIYTDAGRSRLTHHHSWWNEWDEWGEIVEWNLWQGKTGETPKKNLPRLRFVHHETHMEWPKRELCTPVVRCERLTACTT